MPFGLAKTEEIVRPRRRQLHEGIAFHETEVDHVALDDDRVHLADGTVLPYDVLVVATGARLAPEETEGLTGDGWIEKVFTFYTPEGAAALREALDRFEGGRLVVNIVDMPIKCPVAPIEFAFLADWHLRERGIRDRSEIVLATPLDGCFTKPIASKHLTLSARGEGDRASRSSSPPARSTAPAAGSSRTTAARSRSTCSSPCPCTAGAEYVGRSPGLGDELGFVPTDPHTLQALARPNVFAIGDATNLPTSKAGSVTHFEGELLTENVEHFLAGEPLEGSFDGHANCFIETGLRQGAPDRLQLRDRAAARALPLGARPDAAPARVPAQPPRQAHVPVDVLAPAAARPRHPRHLARDAR